MTCLAFSPDGTILASGCSGSGNTGESAVFDVYLWDVARGKLIRQFPAHQGWMQSLSFSPDGKTLATTGPEPTIRLWDVANGREVLSRPGHRGWIRTLAVSPADGTVFTSGQDGSIRRWDPASGRELGTFATFDSPIHTLALDPDGKTLLLGGVSGGLALWSVAERRELRRLPRVEARNAVRYAVFSPDGRTVASERRIWDAASGKVVATFRDPDAQNNRDASYFPIFYSPDGQQIITAEPNGARVWDITSGKESRWIVRSERFHFASFALSPDGRVLARGGRVFPAAEERAPGRSEPIRLIEVASGRDLMTLEGQGSGTRDLAFSPDGRLLVSGSGSTRSAMDPTVRVWDVATGRELRRLEGHLATVNVVAFSADGRSVVTAGEDATALVWDLSDLSDRPMAGPPITAEGFKALWDELAAEDARAAHRATWALSVPSAVPFLGEHLRPAASPDAQGIPAANGPIAPPEVLRTLRGIAALERARTPEARAVLERLARGKPGAIETRDAKSALDRLSRRPRPQAGDSPPFRGHWPSDGA